MSATQVERAADKVVVLPAWPNSKRGTPNSFLRSALFSAIQSKDRIQLDRVVLDSQEGITIAYTGKQLNQEDLTLWETLVHLGKGHPLGNTCEFTAYGLLKALEIPINGKSYERLKDGILRILESTVYINFMGVTFSERLIDSVKVDEETGHYQVTLGNKLIKLYGDSTWTRIDWRQRLSLRKKPLAQFLHGFYSSHKKPFPIKVETLYKRSGSRSKELWKFKQNLKIALDELVAIGFLESYLIDDRNRVYVTRKLLTLEVETIDLRGRNY